MPEYIAYFIDAGKQRYVDAVVDYSEWTVPVYDDMYCCAIVIDETRGKAKSQFITWVQKEWGVDLEFTGPISVRKLEPILSIKGVLDGWTEHYLWDVAHERNLVQDI